MKKIYSLFRDERIQETAIVAAILALIAVISIALL
jgi:hypothetical protein